MKKINASLLFLIGIVLFNSCNPSPTAHIEGVYELDKEAFRAGLAANIDEENSFILDLMDMALKKAKVELQVKGDSINGIIYLIEDVSVMASKIMVRNDTLLVIRDDNEAYLFETETGLSFRSPDSEISLELIRTDKTELSPDSQEMIQNKKGTN